VDTENYIYLDGYADLGETEAMLLYKQLTADWLLIDDRLPLLRLNSVVKAVGTKISILYTGLSLPTGRKGNRILRKNYGVSIVNSYPNLSLLPPA